MCVWRWGTSDGLMVVQRSPTKKLESFRLALLVPHRTAPCRTVFPAGCSIRWSGFLLGSYVNLPRLDYYFLPFISRPDDRHNNHDHASWSVIRFSDARRPMSMPVFSVTINGFQAMLQGPPLTPAYTHRAA